MKTGTQGASQNAMMPAPVTKFAAGCRRITQRLCIGLDPAAGTCPEKGRGEHLARHQLVHGGTGPAPGCVSAPLREANRQSEGQFARIVMTTSVTSLAARQHPVTRPGACRAGPTNIRRLMKKLIDQNREQRAYAPSGTCLSEDVPDWTAHSWLPRFFWPMQRLSR